MASCNTQGINAFSDAPGKEETPEVVVPHQQLLELCSVLGCMLSDAQGMIMKYNKQQHTSHLPSILPDFVKDCWIGWPKRYSQSIRCSTRLVDWDDDAWGRLRPNPNPLAIILAHHELQPLHVHVLHQEVPYQSGWHGFELLR